MFSLISTLIAQREIPLGGITPPTDAYSVGSDTETGALSNLEMFISNIIGFLTILGGIFFLINFVLGAFGWITAGSDSSKVDKARQRMLNGILGMIIIVGSYAILGVLGSIVGLDILNPAETIQNILP